MAKFLTTVGNSYFIEQLILNAKNTLNLVSPFLKLNPNLLDRLNDASKQGIKITLIYGKSELSDMQSKLIFNIENLEIYYCNNLHAKCYFNETDLVISSMNLYEFSEKNNKEMGVLITKSEDPNFYNDTLNEIESIKNASRKMKSFPKDEILETIEVKDVKFEYDQIYNFHLPSLYESILKIYPSVKIELNKEIEISNFPIEGISTVISSRIDFKFKDNSFFEKYKLANKFILNTILQPKRLYWNHLCMNIYLEKNFVLELSENCCQRKIENFIDIINNVYDNILMYSSGEDNIN